MCQRHFQHLPVPDLSISAGSEASMVTQIWDTALDANTLTSYADAAALMNKQRIIPNRRLGSGSKDAGAVDRRGDGPDRSTRKPPGSVRTRDAPQRSRRGQLPPPSTGDNAARHAGHSHSIRSNRVQQELQTKSLPATSRCAGPTSPPSFEYLPQVIFIRASSPCWEVPVPEYLSPSHHKGQQPRPSRHRRQRNEEGMTPHAQRRWR